MTDTINEFISDLKEALKEESQSRLANDKTELNIAYIIAPIFQHLQDIAFYEFITDISQHEYTLTYDDSNSEYYDFGRLVIYLYDEQSYRLDYGYEMLFRYDTRDWGYCQCSSTDEDYRQDKGCCGHGCDWDAPAFELRKITYIGEPCSWDGDEHDFWNFEDNFYKSDEELATENDKLHREYEINRITESIKKLQESLNQLKCE